LEILLGGALPNNLTFDTNLRAIGEAGHDEKFNLRVWRERASGSSRMFKMFLKNNGGFIEPTEASQTESMGVRCAGFLRRCVLRSTSDVLMGSTAKIVKIPWMRRCSIPWMTRRCRTS
jgi:hypothetical protein